MNTFLAKSAATPLTILLLGIYAPATARADPLPVLAVHYGTTIDMTAGVAHFALQLDRAPDLLTVDAFYRQADNFQFWTDTVSTNPIVSVQDGITGAGPLGTQAVLATRELPGTGKLTYIWPQDSSFTGPRDIGGWGSVTALGDYTLDGATVSFDVPLSVLRSVDGKFYYGFETYQYGAWAGVDYFGEAGKDYLVSAVPEPSGLALLAAGLVALTASARRRRTRGLPQAGC